MLGVVGFIPARTRSRSVHLGSFCRALGVVWFHSVAHWGSLGSFVHALGVIGFIRQRRGGSSVYSGPQLVSSGSFESFGRALSVVGFVPCGS